MRIGLYAGSFDPVTRGHEDVIRRSLAFVDRLVVAVATNVIEFEGRQAQIVFAHDVTEHRTTTLRARPS